MNRLHKRLIVMMSGLLIAGSAYSAQRDGYGWYDSGSGSSRRSESASGSSSAFGSGSSSPHSHSAASSAHHSHQQQSPASGACDAKQHTSLAGMLQNPSANKELSRQPLLLFWQSALKHPATQQTHYYDNDPHLCLLPQQLTALNAHHKHTTNATSLGTKIGYAGAAFMGARGLRKLWHGKYKAGGVDLICAALCLAAVHPEPLYNIANYRRGSSNVPKQYQQTQYRR